MAIAAVERDTGLSKDVLRVWERRYGFPQPSRDSHGDRLYPASQVERLHLIKQLLDRGYRPNKVVGLTPEKLQELAARHTQTTRTTTDSEIIRLLQLKKPAALASHLRQRVAAEGLRQFVLGTLADANEAVGEAWRRGDIAVHDEHLYTEQVQVIVRAALSNLPAGDGRPRVMLTTLPGELHILGLLMVEALLRVEGAEVLAYGPQMPINEIAAAATKHDIDVVALSFSSSFPKGTASELVAALRQQLPAHIEIWAGGRGSPSRARLDKIAHSPGLGGLPQAVAAWRQRSH